MKKLISILTVCVLIFSISACSPEPQEKYTMDAFVKAFEAAGAVLEEDKPLFQMVNAYDGVMLYLENSPIKIYEYKDKKAMDKAIEDNSFLQERPKKDLFVLDASGDDAKAIFESVQPK